MESLNLTNTPPDWPLESAIFYFKQRTEESKGEAMQASGGITFQADSALLQGPEEGISACWRGSRKPGVGEESIWRP